MKVDLTSGQHIGIVNWITIAATILGAGSYLAWKPRNLRAQGIMMAGCCTFIGLLTVDLTLTALCHLTTFRLDLYAYRFDAVFGQPSFYLGRILEAHRWLRVVSTAVYDTPGAFFLALATAYYTTQPLPEAKDFMRTAVICLIPAPLLYLVVPVSGPIYAFSTFPDFAPVLHSAHVVYLYPPPNGVPSIHVAFALILLHFARKWKLGILLGSFFAFFTFLSTMGLGEHYLVDVLAAVPHAAISIYLGGSTPLRRTQSVCSSVEGTFVSSLSEGG